MWSSKTSSDDGRRREKALETSNFAQTCNLLSRYMKEKGSLKNLNLEIGGKVESIEALVKPGSTLAANSDLPTNGGKSVNTTSENPIIVVEDDSDKASTSRHGTSKDQRSAQMTIFYSGKVLVFDDFPADKVRDVVHLAKKSSSQMSYGFTSSAVQEKPNPTASTSIPRDGLPPRPHAAGKQHVAISSNTLKEKVSVSISEAGPSSSKAQEELSSTSSEANGSDLPIARRSSLHRFLEKRKDRAALRGPYQNQNQENLILNFRAALRGPYQNQNQENLAPKGDEPLDLNSFPETD